jgi:hypothetical protein
MEKFDRTTLEVFKNLEKRYLHAFKKGEEFNLFNSLNIDNNELIANWLNPHGDHGKGSMFQDLFIENLVKDLSFAIELPNSLSVYSRFKFKHLIDYKVDYHIDVFMCSASKAIIIDNRIKIGDCQDQKLRQLYEFGVQKFGKRNFLLITLTPLEQDSPSLIGFEEKFPEELVKVSCEKFLLGWIRKCIDVSDNDLKIILKQYLQFVKRLVGKARGYFEEFQSNRSIEESGKLSENDFSYIEVTNNSRKHFFEKLITELKSDLNVKVQLVKGGYEYADVIFDLKPRKHACNIGVKLFKTFSVDNCNALEFAMLLEVEEYSHLKLRFYSSSGKGSTLHHSMYKGYRTDSKGLFTQIYFGAEELNNLPFYSNELTHLFLIKGNELVKKVAKMILEEFIYFYNINQLDEIQIQKELLVQEQRYSEIGKYRELETKLNLKIDLLEQ